jgi:hypothetical protein
MVEPPLTNAQRLRATLEVLARLDDEVVLVGGAAAPLLITDPAAAPSSLTWDVDVIVDVDVPGLYRLEGQLRTRCGLTQRPELDDPNCRWRRGDIAIDLVTVDDRVRGFGNRWYRWAWDLAESRVVEGFPIKIISAPLFVATKLEAFADRGRDAHGDVDWIGSKDLEDIVAVVDGRVELHAELAATVDEVRRFVAEGLERLLAEPQFVDALPGHLGGDDGRLPIVADRIRRMAALSR